MTTEGVGHSMQLYLYKNAIDFITQAATVFIDGVTLHLREAIKFSG